MRKIIRVLIIAILLILNLLNGITTAIAQEEVIISLGIPPEVLVSNDFTVKLNTTSLIDFDAGQFDISFDNSVLRLDNVTGGLIGATEIPVSLWNQISPGTYRTIVNVPGIPGVTGSGLLLELIEKINASGAPVLAVDVPSGLDATTGRVDPTAIRACRTVTFALDKKGFHAEDGQRYCGKVEVADIGFPAHLIKEAIVFEKSICAK